MKPIKKRHIFIYLILLTVFFSAFSSVSAFAEEETAYSAFSAARSVTHGDGPFRFKGRDISVTAESASGKTNKTARYYQITGYDYNGAETYIQFETRIPDPKTNALVGWPGTVSTSFLLTPEAIFMKTSKPATIWAEKDISALLQNFVSMGILDQFFMLELLNSDRTEVYKEYMSFSKDETFNKMECSVILVDITRAQFTDLAAELTKDIKSLLGPAADGMSDMQLTLMQSFARGMLAGMDAEIHFKIYIGKNAGRIVRVDGKTDMANPYGGLTPGVTSRIQSESTISLYDFGKQINRVNK